MIVHHEAGDETIPSFKRMLEHNGEAIIVCGHQGNADADTLRALLDGHPNQYADMSALDPFREDVRPPIATQDGRLRKKWEERYSNSVSFYRNILGQLTAETAEKIASVNEAWLITGIPGVGKTTVSRLLAGRMQKAVHIDGDELQEMIVSGAVGWSDQPRGEAARQIGLNIHNQCLLARSFSDTGFVPVLDWVCLSRTHI